MDLSADAFLESRPLLTEEEELVKTVSVTDALIHLLRMRFWIPLNLGVSVLPECFLIPGASQKTSKESIKENMLVYGSCKLQHVPFFSDMDAMEVVELKATSQEAAAEEAADLVQRLASRVEKKGAVFLELKAGVNEEWKKAYRRIRRVRRKQGCLAGWPPELDWRDSIPMQEAVQELLEDFPDIPRYQDEFFIVPDCIRQHYEEWIPRVLIRQNEPGGIDYGEEILRGPKRRLQHHLKTVRWTRKDVAEGSVQLPLSVKKKYLAHALLTSERVMVDALVWDKAKKIYREVSNVLIFKFKPADSETWCNLSTNFRPVRDTLKSLFDQVKIYCELDDPLKASKRLASMLRRVLRYRDSIDQSSSGLACLALEKLTYMLRRVLRYRGSGDQSSSGLACCLALEQLASMFSTDQSSAGLADLADLALKQLNKLQPILVESGQLKLLAVLIDAMLDSESEGGIRKLANRREHFDSVKEEYKKAKEELKPKYPWLKVWNFAEPVLGAAGATIESAGTVIEFDRWPTVLKEAITELPRDCTYVITDCHGQVLEETKGCPGELINIPAKTDFPLKVRRDKLPLASLKQLLIDASAEIAVHKLQPQKGGWQLILSKSAKLYFHFHTKREALVVANKIVEMLVRCPHSEDYPHLSFTVQHASDSWMQMLMDVAKSVEKAVPDGSELRKPPDKFCPSASDSQVSAAVFGLRPGESDVSDEEGGSYVSVSESEQDVRSESDSEDSEEASSPRC